jgi:hypothetical protein
MLLANCRTAHLTRPANGIRGGIRPLLRFDPDIAILDFRGESLEGGFGGALEVFAIGGEGGAVTGTDKHRLLLLPIHQTLLVGTEGIDRVDHVFVLGIAHDHDRVFGKIILQNRAGFVEDGQLDKAGKAFGIFACLGPTARQPTRQPGKHCAQTAPTQPIDYPTTIHAIVLKRLLTKDRGITGVRLNRFVSELSPINHGQVIMIIFWGEGVGGSCDLSIGLARVENYAICGYS